MKNIRNFSFENFHFLVVKFSVYLNSCVSVMIYDKLTYNAAKEKKMNQENFIFSYLTLYMLGNIFSR